MEVKGRLIGTSLDVMTGKMNITFELDTKPTDSLMELMEIGDLDITAKKHRKKRSLDANAYFHVLVGKIAEKVGSSKTRAKNILIGRYGQQDFIDEQPVIIKTNVDVDKMLEQEILHCVPCKVSQDAVFYKVYRGSHTYNTKEMSVLIEGTVNEAKELGIETMTHNQIAEMLSKWKGQE